MTVTSEQLTSPPAEDQYEHAKTKIRNRITPRHHDPLEINFSVAAAPSVLIVAAADSAALPGGSGKAAGAGGVSC